MNNPRLGSYILSFADDIESGGTCNNNVCQSNKDKYQIHNIEEDVNEVIETTEGQEKDYL